MDESSSDALKDKLAPLLGRIPSGVFILVAGNDTGQQTGMLASWVQQAAFNPPSISVGVKKGRPIENLIDASGHFLVNLIGENSGPMFKHFGKGFEPGEPAFDGVACRANDAGCVLESGIAPPECTLAG